MLRAVVRIVVAAAMVAVGVAHLIWPEPFVRIVPDWLPAAGLLVAVSGVCEIAGGVGLLIPRTRRLASFGLVALYIAVFPANIHMAVHDIQLSPGGSMPNWAMWARLPLQLVFIAAALWVGRDGTPASDEAAT